MSGTSPESNGDHTDSERKDMPRKRSKVSRACDACRRKKVRCDAEFLSTLQKVTKMCTNCLRTNDVCTFARVPLKRGPTKGYSRDSGDRADEPLDMVNRSRLGLDLAPYSILPSNNPVTAGLPSTSLGPQTSLSLSLTSTAALSATSISSMTGNAFSHLSSAQSNHARIATPPSPVPQQLVKPILHRLKFLPSLPAPPIILPPLLGTAQGQTGLVKITVPPAGATISPGPLLAKSADVKDARIQGPLWKVPYEMPEASGLDPMSPGSMSLNSRRSSVDSVSSILTAGLRSRLPSLQPLTSLNSELAISDSESEDVYVSRARASISPQNSVSSLLSLNGRVGKLLTISGTVAPSALAPSHSHSSSVGSVSAFAPVPTQMYGYNGTQGAKLKSSYDSPQQMDLNGYSSRGFYGSQFTAPHANTSIVGTGPPVVVVPNSPESNFRTYYSRFHPTFPILPMDEQKFLQTLSDLLRESPQSMQLVQLFYAALNNLICFQTVSLEAQTNLLHHFLDLRQFERPGLPTSNNTITVVMALMILINYTLLIQGSLYSLAISVAGGLFSDLKVTEKYLTLCGERATPGPDEILVYLPRLQLCLFIIDDCYALAFGTHPRVQGNFDLLVETLPERVREPGTAVLFWKNLPLAHLFHKIAGLKAQDSLNKHKLRSSVIGEIPSTPEPSFMPLVMTIIRDKYEVYDFSVEVLSFLATLPDSMSRDEDVREQIYDSQLKLVRLVRKLSLSILDFANYISSMYFQLKAPSADSLSSPYFNVSFGHCLKLINVCKKLLDTLIQHMREGDIINRLLKINNDLSISYNLLVSNLNNNFNSIGKSFGGLNRGSSGSSQGTADSLDVGGLGVGSIQLISSKLDTYNLTFNNIPARFGQTSNGNPVADVNAWKNEFINIFKPLLLNEDIEGWF